MEGKFRISFSINENTPFIWKGFHGISTYERAVELFNLLCNFDLGRATAFDIDNVNGGAMITSYKAYRRNSRIWYSSDIDCSYGSIDCFKDGKWWIVSESGDEVPDFEIGEMEAFDEF
jgi:hypothetical protein